MAQRQEPLDLNWLTHERLIDFMDGLREAGYNIGLTQYAIAQDLVLALTTQDQLGDVAQVGRMLGSVLCSTPFEQDNFQYRFHAWLELLDIVAENPLPLEKELEQVEQQSKRTKWKLISASMVLVCVGLLTPLLMRWKPKEPQPENPEIPTEILQQELVQASPIAEPLPEEKGGLFEQVRNFLLSLLQWDLRWFTWLSPVVLAILIPCVALVLWRLWWEQQARQFLQRYATGESPEFSNISTLGLQESLFAPTVFLKIARQLRQRMTIPSVELDIDKTLTASLDRGGWLTPVYGDRKVLPEYLCLIEQNSYRDHQTQFVQEAIARLTENGVFISAYTFNGDPRVCSPYQRKGTPKRLSELVAKHGGDRLLIFAETEVFFRSDTGRLAAWIRTLTRWQERAILTAKPTEHWDHQEEELAEEFTVLPSTINGLELLIEKLQSNKKDSLVTSQVNDASFPEVLRLNPRRWIERNPPRTEKIQLMQTDLKDYLQGSYYWLCACAIFPKLTWNLTVFLGNSIKTESDLPLLEASSINNLIRLPWLRYGYMPDWLRLDLISQLTTEQEQDIRRALHELLINLIRGGNNEGFEIIHHPQLASQLAKPLVRILAKNAAIGSEFQDSIFVNFMLDRPDQSLAVEIPDNNNILERRYIPRNAWLQPLGLATGLFVISLGIYQAFNTNRELINETNFAVNNIPTTTELTVPELEFIAPKPTSTILDSGNITVSDPENIILPEPEAIIPEITPIIPEFEDIPLLDLIPTIKELEPSTPIKPIFPKQEVIISELESTTLETVPTTSEEKSDTTSETTSENPTPESATSETKPTISEQELILPTPVLPLPSSIASLSPEPSSSIPDSSTAFETTPATSEQDSVITSDILPTPRSPTRIGPDTIPPAPISNTTRGLQKGDKGQAVLELQEKLVQLGFNTPVNGVFGSETEVAVKAFQSNLRLDPDGIVGLATMDKLDFRVAVLTIEELTTDNLTTSRIPISPHCHEPPILPPINEDSTEDSAVVACHHHLIMPPIN